MYRSSSTNRVWDDYVQYQSSSPSGTSRLSAHVRSISMDSLEQQLPMYELSAGSFNKKDNKFRPRFNAVHFIPLSVFLCALVLWFFSNPYIQLPLKNVDPVAMIEGMTVEGELDPDSTQSGALAGIDLGELDGAKTHERHRASTSKNKRVYF